MNEASYGVHHKCVSISSALPIYIYTCFVQINNRKRKKNKNNVSILVCSYSSTCPQTKVSPVFLFLLISKCLSIRHELKQRRK